MISLEEHIDNCEKLKKVKKELMEYINCRCDIRVNLLRDEEDLEDKISKYTEELLLE